MSPAEIRKIAIDEVVESAAAGVLRALDARAAASGHAGTVPVAAHELVKSGFFIDFVIRAGGYPGPLEILGKGALGQNR